MAESSIKNCCYLCDMDMSLHSEDNPLGMKQYEVSKLISAVKQCLPNINKYQFDLICQSCLLYITYFNEVRTKWEGNELIIKRKRQFGRFRGLKDIVHPKKTSTHICRLCFKETNTQDVTFIYHDDQVYQSGYVQTILSSHSPHTDLSLTENPIICHVCLDIIQTFDAFYQMWLQALSTKGQLTNPVEVIQNDENPQVDSFGNIVHVQLRKTSANTVTMRTITEAESAVNSLPNVKDSLIDKSDKIITAWTTKNVLDLVQNRTAQHKVNISDDDICVISDDEEIETQRLHIDTTQIKKTLNTENERVEILPLKEDITCYSDFCSFEKHHNAETQLNLADSLGNAKQTDIVDALFDKNVQNLNPINLEINMSHVKSVLESSYVASISQNLKKTVNYSKKIIESIGEPAFMTENGIVLTSVPTLEANMGEINGVKLTDGTLVEAGKFTFVEVDDSDSQNSDDAEDVSNHLLQKTYFNENFEDAIPLVEINMDKDKQSLHSEENTKEGNHCDKDGGFLYISNDSDEGVIPSIEINMTRVNELFQTITTNKNKVVAINSDESTISLAEDIPSIEISMSKVNEIIETTIDKSTTRKNKLEHNLSDFLQFKKPAIFQLDIEADEIIDVEAREQGLMECQKPINAGPEVKKGKFINFVPTKSEKNVLPYHTQQKTFTSAFEEFLEKDKLFEYYIPSVGCLSNKNEKEVCTNLNSVQNMNNEQKKISESTSEIVVVDDDSDEHINDEYCKWFPYEQHILEKGQGKLFNKTKKVDATVLETRLGSKLFRCNMCLLAVEKESDLLRHGCVKEKEKKRFSCQAKKCTFTTDFALLLKQHLLFHILDNASWYKCHICEFNASEKNLLIIHHKQCHQMGTVQRNSKCPHCFFESDIPDILSHHILARHVLEKSKDQTNDCSNPSTNKLSNLADQRNIKYNCQQCNFFCYEKRHLRKHTRYIHSTFEIQ